MQVVDDPYIIHTHGGAVATRSRSAEHEETGLARGDRRVAFHADDFGMNRAVTDGILQGFRQGLLTSTSLLANAPDAGRALAEWDRLEQDRRGGVLPSSALRKRLGDPDCPFDLGVHLNLTQGRPLRPAASRRSCSTPRAVF